MWFIVHEVQAFKELPDALRAAQCWLDDGEPVKLIDGAEVKLVVSDGEVSKTRGTE